MSPPTRVMFCLCMPCFISALRNKECMVCFITSSTHLTTNMYDPKVEHEEPLNEMNDLNNMARLLHLPLKTKSTCLVCML